MSKILVIQQVCLGYGGWRKTIRNTLKIPVQRLDCKDPVIVHHLASYVGFKPYEETIVNISEPSVTVGCVTVEYTEEEVSATFRYNYQCAGKPDRSWVEKTLILPANEWGQICYNGRFAKEANWIYRTVVINVGLFDRLIPELFTQQEPVSRFASIAKLGW